MGVGMSGADGGNRGGPERDYPDVDCESYREALSAQLDSEDPGMDPARVDAHLARCADCRAWLRQAARVTRAARVQPAEQVPDLTETVLTRVRREVPTTRGDRRTRGAAMMRVALCAVAAAQWAAGLAVLFGPAALGALPVHGAHELGAFNLAVAAGFAWTAWRPARAGAHLPLLATLVVVLAAATIADLLAGHATLTGEAGHLLLAAGLGLTAVLARAYRERGQPPSGSGALTPGGDTPGGAGAPILPRGLRPARWPYARARDQRRAA